jgi:sulfonate transport system permease protein
MADIAIPASRQRNISASIQSPILRGLVIPALLVIAWILFAHLHGNSLVIVPLERILAAPFADDAGRNLWPSLAASVMRFTSGFALGVGAGMLVGLTLGMSQTADRAVAPSINALRQIALFAWIPLLTAWFGNGDVAKIIYISLSAFFPAALNTQNGLRAVSLQHLEVARVLRLSHRQRITRLLLPAALPSIFIGVQIALIGAWLGTVGAEYAMGNGQGIGTFIAQGREQFRMDIVAVGVFALALVGYAINLGCVRLFRHLLAWQGNAS